MSQTALCVSAHSITPSRILSLTFMQHAQPDMPWSRPPDAPACVPSPSRPREPEPATRRVCRQDEIHENSLRSRRHRHRTHTML